MGAWHCLSEAAPSRDATRAGETIAAMSTSLNQAVTSAGYYPALANHVVRSAVSDEKVRAHFVHAETTFDSAEVRRHMSVLVLTDTRLIRVHIDDAQGPEVGGARAASATVDVTHVVHQPERFRDGQAAAEVVLSVGWGVHSRIDLEPASCGDERCDADHGYTGDLTGDDTLARVSLIADGEETVRALEDFARFLHRAVGR